MNDAAVFAQVLQAFREAVPAHQLNIALQDPSPETDLALLQELLAAQQVARLVRLWSSPRTLVTSPRLARLEGFERAVARSMERGWPVAIRPSAGLTVALHPGVLNVSVISVREGGAADAYDDLLGLLITVCGRMGIAAERGSVPGAYCDGSQNLRICGRKAAGASARQVSRSGFTGLLSHACLTVFGNVAEDVEAVREFEMSLGLDAPYRVGAHCTVADFLDSMSNTGLPSVAGSAVY